MEATEIVGYRFHPSHKNLVSYHLKRRLLGIKEKKCLIPDLNIYDYEPWDLHRIYNEKADKKSCGKECFFFCPRNSGGGRTNRKAGGGYWKDTSRKKTIKAGNTSGIKRIFVFYEGKQKDSRKTEWVMHEYHLNALNEGAVDDLGAYALCRFKRKPMTKKEKALASTGEAKLSSPSTAIVEVEEPTHELEIDNAVINTDVNESPDCTSGMINVDELLQDIRDKETNQAISHESAPLFQHQIEDILPDDASTSNGELHIDDTFQWLYDLAGDFAEDVDVCCPGISDIWTVDKPMTLL